MQRSDKIIPYTIHLIWFGGMLPNTESKPYVSNILKHKTLNRDYQLCLWSDSQSMTADNYKKLTEFCQSNQIELKNIQDSQLPNLALINQELRIRAWARASDIVRMSVLYTEGGLYFDTDLVPVAPLTMNHAPKHGMLHHVILDKEIDPEQRFNIYFMASIKRHPFYLSCIKFCEMTYDKLNNQTYAHLFLNSNDLHVAEVTNTLLTYGVFAEIYNHSGYREICHEIVYPYLRHHVNIECHGSWVEGKRSDINDQHARVALLYFDHDIKQLLQSPIFTSLSGAARMKVTSTAIVDNSYGITNQITYRTTLPTLFRALKPRESAAIATDRGIVSVKAADISSSSEIISTHEMTNFDEIKTMTIRIKQGWW